jgi:long-chain acyl-CoA synthetase
VVTYADKPWVKHYPAGMKESLGYVPDRTVQSYLQDTARRMPNRPALVTSVRLPMVGHQKHVYTYKELDELSDNFAAALIGLGVQKGQIVALLMPNISAFVIAYYGILKAGAVVATINPAYPANKIQYQANDCDAEVLVTITALYNTFKEVQHGTKVNKVIVSNIKEFLAPLARAAFSATQEEKGGHALREVQEGDYWFQDLLKQYKGKKSDVVVSADDIAFLQYTGGTTGIPKGAVATHRMLAFSTEQVATWTDVDYAQKYGKNIKRENFTSVVALPMFHIFGLIVVLNQSIVCGWQMLMVPDPRDANNLIDLIATYKPEVMCAVPLLWHSLTTHDRVKSGDVSFKHMYIAISAASPLHGSIVESATKAGVPTLTDAYGLSEVPIGNHANPILGPARASSVGMALPDTNYRIVDLDTGTKLMPVGEIGEIIIDAPNVMLGYYNKPEETAKVIREFEGKRYLYTGDVGKMDEEGFLYLVDRKKDMAIIGGFNVYPAAVEKVLKMHPAVEDAGVWYVPHPKVMGEEAVQGWIKLREGQTVKSGELVAFCRPFLAAYEIPRKYVFVEKLPYNDAGKLVRRELMQVEAKDAE